MAGAALVLLGAVAPLRAQLEDGDRAWDTRAERLDGALAVPERIEEALRAYRDALGARGPQEVEARWKLLRALHYLVDFTAAAPDRKEAAVSEAVTLARCEPAAAGSEAFRADLAQLCFWSAIAWGARAQRAGLLTIVREGVASRIEAAAQQALALDPAVEQGGGYRLLSRLHATVPRLPVVSPWADRGRVVPLAEAAMRVDPAHPGNRLVLALALLEQAPDRRAEALALLGEIARAEPRREWLVEDLAIREEARRRLGELGAGHLASGSP